VAVREILQRGRRDPVWFVERVIGAPLWHRQREVVEAVWSSKRVAVKAAHSVGKTYVAARIALAFHYLYPRSRVITTAPTWSQVSKLLWSEIATAHGRMPVSMGSTLLGTELRSAPDHFVLGLSTDEADRFQGHHAEHLLVILDEGPGVRGDIWEAAFSLLAGGDARLLAIGNPTETAGPFYEAFTANRERWSCHTVSAFDNPNFDAVRGSTDTETTERVLALSPDELEQNSHPFLTTRGWVAEAAAEWGVGSPPWQSRVLGDFPSEADDSLLALGWLEASVARHADPAATARWLESLPAESPAHCEDPDQWQVGIDVAGPGADETVVVVRHGRRVVEMRAWSGRDARGDVLSCLEHYRDREPLVCVDSIGIGYYMAQQIRDAGYRVSEVNVGRPAVDKSRYANWKAELFWHLRGRLQAQSIDLPDDRKLVSQASALRYRYSGSGKVEIESKEQIARRGGKSPDRLEAVMLAYAASNRLQLTRRSLGSEIVL